MNDDRDEIDQVKKQSDASRQRLDDALDVAAATDLRNEVFEDRVLAEGDRQMAEGDRQTAEGVRQAAEGDRQAAEGERQAAEMERQKDNPPVVEPEISQRVPKHP